MELPVRTSTERRAFETRPLPAEFTEPENRPDYLPYEPTPAGLYAECDEIKMELLDHQQVVDREFETLFMHAPEGIPEGLREAVLIDYLAGEAQRRIKNLESYRTWGDEDKAEHREEEKALLLGTITPSETVSLLQQSELHSAELAKVTHPYQYRMEYVTDARNDVNNAITAHNGVLYPTVASYRKIGFQPDVATDMLVSEMKLNGFRVTYKRKIGHVTKDSGRRVYIIERQSAAIRVDKGANDLDPAIGAALRQPSTEGKTDVWLDRVKKETDYETYFTEAIQQDTTADFFIPLSTMWYAREESQEEYEARQKNETSAAQLARITLNKTASNVHLLR